MSMVCSSFKTHFLNMRFACFSLSRKFKSSDFLKNKMEFRTLESQELMPFFYRLHDEIEKINAREILFR